MITTPASFWLTALNLPDPTPTALPPQADVVVIGGGITGVSTTYWLSQLGLTPLLIERGHLASGATGRNGGHFVFGGNQHFGDSLDSMGLEATRTLWDFTDRSAQTLRHLVHTHAIDCDLHFNRFVTFALTPDQADAIQANYQQMVSHGLPAEYWDTATVSQQTQSDAFFAAFVEPQHGQLWPAKLVLGLAAAAQRQGAQIHTQTSVQALTRQGNQLSITTDRGSVATQIVVYATNAFSYHLLPELKEVIVPVRGQVIATAPTARLFDFDWLTYQGYEYAIQRRDGRIIFGGMRRQSPSQELGIEDDSTLEPHVSQGLRTFLGKAFPTLQPVPIEYEWTGIMGFTPDQNPLIGQLPGRPGEYIAAGYTGHGVSLGLEAGRAMAEQIAGGTNRIPPAFAPGRFWP